MNDVIDLTKRLHTLPEPAENINGFRRLVMDIRHDPDPLLTAQLDAVDELTAAIKVDYGTTEAERQAAEIAADADSFGDISEPADPGTAVAVAYGDWNPLEHIPADPSVMSQSGWVCNSKRAAIKQAYEKQLHRQYNALFAK